MTSSCADRDSQQRYVAWFHELDAWTEYWDVYHPETLGRFYFGNAETEQGLLTRFLPRERTPPALIAWKRMALFGDAQEAFAREIRVPEVASAVMEVDALLSRLFAKHFGDAADRSIQSDYLRGILCFAMDTLPPAVERDSRISADDPRKATAGRHNLDGDIMWFAWALHLEAAHLISGVDGDHPRRALLLAGVAIGCPANFAWRGHRRTRAEYAPDPATVELLHKRGLGWCSYFGDAAREVHTLFRIREWGCED
jgi:hypothetical protein